MIESMLFIVNIFAGCGFVNFSTAEQAQAAIEGTNEKITLPGVLYRD
jgi:hypothetical protein